MFFQLIGIILGVQRLTLSNWRQLSGQPQWSQLIHCCFIFNCEFQKWISTIYLQLEFADEK
jgi:hypothetical protein